MTKISAITIFLALTVSGCAMAPAAPSSENKVGEVVANKSCPKGFQAATLLPEKVEHVCFQTSPLLPIGARVVLRLGAQKNIAEFMGEDVRVTVQPVQRGLPAPVLQVPAQ